MGHLNLPKRIHESAKLKELLAPFIEMDEQVKQSRETLERYYNIDFLERPPIPNISILPLRPASFPDNS